MTASTPPKNSLLAQLLKEPGEKQYFEEVGRFITAYAKAEAAAHMNLRKFSMVSDQVGRLLFSGLRISDSSKKLRDMVLLNADEKTAKEVTSLLDQLDIISEERNRLVHYSSDYVHEMGLVTSNKFTVRSEAHLIERTFSLLELQNMTLDCMQIFIRFLSVYLNQDNPSERHPWLHKRALPNGWQKQPRKTGRKHKRPPEPSEG